MKQTKNFNIVVPELGDKPDITQVSNAIQSLEDALAGTLEVMNATLNGTALTLVSGARTTKRTKYYDGMSIRFIAPSQIAQNTLTSVKVDDLSVQTLQVPYLVNSGDSVDIVYKTNKFVGVISAVQRSNDINSTSTTTVATSNAVKQLNDNKAEKSIQIIAGNGLTGGGNLTSNKTINIVSADEGIIVNSDNIKLNTINAVNSTNAIRPASANAAKTAYDKGVEALAKGNEALTHSQNVNNAKVSKSGDVMTGSLTAPYFTMSNVQGLLSSQLTTTNKQVVAADNGNRVYLGNPEINKLHLEVNSATSACVTVNSTPYTIYHQGFKPTSSDVGLGNVNNWVATTAVNDPSTTKYATASAAKIAYDKGVEALNKANSANSNADTRVLKENGLANNLTVDKYLNFGDYDNNDIIKTFARGGVWNTSFDNMTLKNNWVYHTGRKPSASDVGAVNKSGDTMTGNLKISSTAPLIEFDSPSSTGGKAGYVGAGSSANIFQIVNRATGKALNLHSNGKLMYDGKCVLDDSLTFQVLPNGLPTPESIRDLAQGVYKIANGPVYSLGNGYYTVVRLTSQSQTGDNHCAVYPDGGPNEFYRTGFNSGNWTGWKTYYSNQSSAYHKNLTLDGGYLYNTVSGFGVVGQIANMSVPHVAYELRSSQGSLGFGVTTNGTVNFWNGSGNGTNGNGKSAFMHVGGNQTVTFEQSLHCNGNVTAYSDMKLKKDLEVIPDAIEKIMAINGYTYTRIDSGERQTGVVAQEVQNVLPEAVSVSKARPDSKDQSDTLSVAYGNMVGLLIEGIKEQKKTIDSLEERLERLEKLLEGR